MLYHKNKKDKKTKSVVSEMAATLPEMNQGNIPGDVLGSYTGTDEDGGEPTQDADDL